MCCIQENLKKFVPFKKYSSEKGLTEQISIWFMTILPLVHKGSVVTVWESTHNNHNVY